MATMATSNSNNGLEGTSGLVNPKQVCADFTAWPNF
jgi:hypothetical protein